LIYLTTGANGSGKTLLTLHYVQQMAVKESRPVFHNGRFEIIPGGPLDSWKKCDFADWQSLPEGSIIFVDECHNEMPVRTGAGGAMPEYIRGLAEHRRRGYDFFLITQHPLNIDSYVRRLIGAPGWHRHLKRASGAQLASVLEWPSVHDQPQKAGSGQSGEVTLQRYPTEVFKWYQSTSLDTAKVKIPRALKVLLASFLIVPLVSWYAIRHYSAMASKVAPSPDVPAVSAKAVESGSRAALSAPEFMASFVPRVEGFPNTAPRYEELAKPVTAPRIAACAKMGDRCQCYTQQATLLDTPAPVCAQIVAHGFFDDTLSPSGSRNDSVVYRPKLEVLPSPVAPDAAVLESPPQTYHAARGKI